MNPRLLRNYGIVITPEHLHIELENNINDVLIEKLRECKESICVKLMESDTFKSLETIEKVKILRTVLEA